MDRRSLEYFRTVAQLGSVSAAASRMSVTQPAISKQISRLETELAMRLFHRTPSGMVLTAEGETLLELGGDILTRFERAEGTMQTRFSGKPVFRVACPHTTAYVLVAPFMVDFDPAIVDLLIVTAPEVDGMLHRDADLAVSTLPPPVHRRRLEVADIPITLQGSPRMMRERFGDADVADLERLGDDWVIVPRTGVQETLIDATAGWERPLTMRDASTGSVAQALAANEHGFALVTEQVNFGLSVLPARSAGRLVAVTLHASWDVQHYAGDELERMVRSFSHWMAITPPWGSPPA